MPFGTARTKGFANAILSFFQAGSVSLTRNGLLVYSVTPGAANKLVGSITFSAFADKFGNQVLAGITSYTPTSAININLGGIEFFSAPNQTGGWGLSPSSIGFGGSSLTLQSSNTVFLESGNPIVVNANNNASNNISNLTTINTGGSTGRLAEQSTNNITTPLDESISGNGVASGNVIVPTLITPAFPTDASNGANPGTMYTIKTHFNGVWGNNVMTIYVDINGTSTALCTIGGALGASGDTVDGWLELEFYVVSATACRVAIGGVMRDPANSANILPGNTAAISSTVVTGIAFAAGDTIGIAIAFTTSVAAQTIQTQFSRFTRTAG